MKKFDTDRYHSCPAKSARCPHSGIHIRNRSGHILRDRFSTDVAKAPDERDPRRAQVYVQGSREEGNAADGLLFLQGPCTKGSLRYEGCPYAGLEISLPFKQARSCYCVLIRAPKLPPPLVPVNCIRSGSVDTL